jgi:phosphate ABC transporter phosphate-binding protein
MSATSEQGKGQGEEMEAIRHRRSRRGLWIAVAAVVVVVLIVAYGALSGWFSPSATQSVTLVGAGATFPYPLISKWMSVYENSTGVKVNYQAIGSGGGISQITAKTVDFAGSDAPLNAAQRAGAPGLVHIPETIGAVTFAYNVPGLATGLNVTGELVASIFLGDITNWNDASIAALNPGVTLPNQPITVVHRSDGSGTTFIWTNFLSKHNLTWKNDVGSGTTVQWPVGIGAPGNSGVAGKIQQTTYAAGYVELAYTIQNSMTVAKIKNPAGSFIAPTLNSTAAAAAGAAPTLPSGTADWFNVSVIDAAGATSYPIASFTYLLIYQHLETLGSSMTQTKAAALVKFLWWCIHDGQSYSASLVYVPLPQAVRTLDETTLNSITFNGQAVPHT